MSRNQYWEECIASSLDEHGITVTSEQITAIAADIAGAHECYGMAFYTPENPALSELREAKAELQKEREKVVCRPCGGRGRIITPGPYHSSDSQCCKCNGEGKVSL